MRGRRPPIKKCYKVLDSKGNTIGMYFGFILDYVENKFPHHRIVKVNTNHPYQGSKKNHRNAN